MSDRPHAGDVLFSGTPDARFVALDGGSAAHLVHQPIRFTMLTAAGRAGGSW
jgi:hypothetical protein